MSTSRTTRRLNRSLWIASLALALGLGMLAPASAQLTDADQAAIDTLIATKPSTPRELLRAADTIDRLGDAALAKQYLQQLVDLNANDQQLADLLREFGSPMLVRMAMKDDLQPAGQQLADKIFAAHKNVYSDPATIKAWIAELQATTERTRFEAMDSLRRSGGAAVAPLVAVLADDARSDEHKAVRSVLRKMGDGVREPLLAILDDGDAKMKAASLRALSEVGSASDAIFMLSHYAAPDADPNVKQAAASALMLLTGERPNGPTAAAYLANRARQCIRHTVPLPNEMEGSTSYWTYDPATSEIAQSYISTDEAYRRLAARFAAEAYAIDPENKEIARLYARTMLEQAAYENGLDTPLDMTAGSPAQEASKLGVLPLIQIAREALDDDRPAAAAAAIRVLGQIGTAKQLIIGDSGSGLLIEAVKHRDARVRFAAVEAVLALDPETTYPGASDVITALLHMTTARGRHGAVVIGSNNVEANRIAAYLGPMGFEPTTALNGQDGLRFAAESADTELLLIDAGVRNPHLEILLPHVRLDCRTANLPVAVLASADQLDRAEFTASRDPLAMALPRPYRQDSIDWGVEHVDRLARDKTVPADVRLERAKQALQWLSTLYENDRQNVRQRWQDIEAASLAALATPTLREESLGLLAQLPTPGAQTALVDLASRVGQPIEDRQAALEAFFDNAEANGLLLTQSQVMRQYDRYNASERDTRESQAILGAILDWFEADVPMDESQPAQETTSVGE